MASTASSTRGVPLVFADERAKASFNSLNLEAFLRDLSAAKFGWHAIARMSAFPWSDIEDEEGDETLILRFVVRRDERQALKLQRLASKTLADFTHRETSFPPAVQVSLEVVREEDDATSLSSRMTF